MTDRLLPPGEDLTRTVAVVAVEPGRAVYADRIVAAYDEHQRSLFTFARAMLGDADLADDCVQDTFLRLVRIGEASGGMPDNVGGWLHRVCGNVIMSQLRRRKVRNRVRTLLAPRNEVPSAEDTMVHRERHDRLRVHLDALAPDARMALLLAAAGLSGRQIASTLGRSEAATRVLISRARRRLRELIAREEAGP